MALRSRMLRRCLCVAVSTTNAGPDQVESTVYPSLVTMDITMSWSFGSLLSGSVRRSFTTRLTALRKLLDASARKWI